jgi:hypothetical protein
MLYEIFDRMKKGERFTAGKIVNDYKTTRQSAHAVLTRIQKMDYIVFRILTRLSPKGQAVAEKEFYYSPPKKR